MSIATASYKHHFLIAFAIAIWLSIFLILIAPFDIAELPLKARLEILPVYGLISFVGYMLLIPFQNWAYKKLKKRSIAFEILFIALFNIMVLLGSYWYYKSSIVNGNYSFIKFTFEIYYPIFFILLPVIIFARWFINRKAVHPSTKKIILTGDNKLDILQIKEEDLICVSSADNYVEVAYVINTELYKKLLRTTLKNMEAQLPQLMKVHRSHLINPIHFKAWKNANTLLLTQIEVPISKNYKKEILAMNHSPLKADDSSQS
ncbi:LytTR family DNA-binding domain-containing protein [uncultured Kordia sp.]|uniref:LytTR family DNA-binding domain-containing protein n=1 Tax=uncultured Kordia sp. TaxID=507699 RepID=UPI002632CC95|nr:LytTR family DNA-binding domain-containing protein [uncultured Kordia sp.]